MPYNLPIVHYFILVQALFLFLVGWQYRESLEGILERENSEWNRRLEAVHVKFRRSETGGGTLYDGSARKRYLYDKVCERGSIFQ